MKFIIPIQNLFVEGCLIMEDVIFLPSHLYEKDHSPLLVDGVEEELIEKVYNILNNCAMEYQQLFQNYAVAIIEHPFTQGEFDNTVPIHDFEVLENVCYKVDMALDQIRLNKCDFMNKDLLPGIPGIIGNYQYGIVVDMEKNFSREILGKVYTLIGMSGIGLDMDCYDVDDQLKRRKIFENNRNDIIFNKCRTAIRRINEAYYFPNLNSCFVYLMSTLEMLASSEYTQFKKVKTNIVSFIANDKREYHQLCNRLRVISEDIRTEIVHNGKSLYDIIETNREIERLLGFVTNCIVEYCENVIDLNIITEEELISEREKRINQLT